MADQDLLSGVLAHEQGSQVAPAYDPGPQAGLPAQAPEPPGAAKIADLQASGKYSSDQIASWKADAKQQAFKDGKYTPQQIDAYYGDNPADTSSLTNLVAHNLGRNTPQDGSHLSWGDAFRAGFDTSATAAALDLSNGHHFSDIAPTHMGIVNQVIAGAGQLSGDAAFSVAGFFGGAFAGGGTGAVGGAAVPVAGETGASEVAGAIGGAGAGGLFGSGAAPQAMREVTMNLQRDHTNYSWQDVARDIAVSSFQIAKSGALSLVGGKVGGAVTGKVIDAGFAPIVGHGAGAVAAAATATTAAGALEGRIPSWQDYTTGAITMLGFGAAMHVVGGRPVPSEAGRRVAANLQTIYRQTGVDPTELTEAAKDNPVLRQELLAQDVNGEPVFPHTRAAAGPEPQPFGRTVPRPGTPEADAVISQAMHHMTVDQDVGLMTELEGSGDTAISPKGAVGRHQIMPGTARQYGFDPTLLTEPAYNETVARTVMTDLYRRFNGDTEAMMAAYNAGPKRGAELQASGPGTRLEAEVDPAAHATGGIRYTSVSAQRDESFLPLETQRYLANARRRAGGALPGSEHTGGEPPEPPSADAGERAMLTPQAGEGGAGEPPEPPPPNVPAVGGEPPEGDGFTNTGEAYDTMREMVGEEKQKNDLLDPSKNMAQWISELDPLRRVDTELLKANPGLNRNQDVMLEDMGRQLYGSDGRAAVFVRYGIVDPIKFDIDRSASIAQATQQVKDAGGNLADWKMWMAAKRTLDKEAQGTKTGFDPLAAAQIMGDKGEAAKYAEATKTFNRVMDGALEYGAGSGLFSDEQVAAMKEANPTYMSFRRVMGDDRFGPGARKGFQPKNPLHMMEGSDRQIIDPLVATIDNMRQIVRESDRNRLIGSVIMAQEQGNDLGLVKIGDASVDAKEAGTALAPYVGKPEEGEPDTTADDFAPLLAMKGRGALGADQFMFFRNGKPEVWSTTNPDLARLLKGTDSPGEADIVTKTFQGVASILRTGITSMVDFPTRVAFRHQIFAWITDSEHPPPGLTWIGGAMHALKLDEEWQDFLAKGGGVVAATEIDRDYLAQDIEKVFKDTNTFQSMWNTVSHPLELAHMVNERMDAAPRIGYKLRAEEQGMDPIKATTKSRTAMIDFTEHGTGAVANWMAKTTPFFRPFLLGWKNIGQGVSENPIGTVSRALLAVTVPTVALFVLNRLQDQHLPADRQYKNLAQWQKDLGYVTPEIGGVRFHMPYPFQYGAPFGIMVTRFLESLVDKDPHAFDGWALSMMHEMLPAMTPAAILPALETITNHNFYTGRPLMPDSQAKLSGPMQYTPATTAPAKALARILQPLPFVPGQLKSPIDIEHLVKGYTGGVGYLALKALDMPFKRTGEPWQVADIPFVQSFVVRNPGMGAAPIENFFTDFSAYEQAHSDIKALIQRSAQTPEQAELQGEALRQTEGGDFRGTSQINAAATKVANAQRMATGGADQVMAQTYEKMRYQRLEQRQEALFMQQAILQQAYRNDKMTVDEKRQFTDRVYSDMIATANDAERILKEPASQVAGEL